ncbi:MAG: SagB/ThcOx family dehydrogenase, partial [Usitatibacteraceae bacterium]
LRPLPTMVEGQIVIALPAPEMSGGMPLFDALRLRRSTREFQPTPLSKIVLSNLLWAGYGINRKDESGRTAPSAMNAQDVDIYAALPGGLYRYDARRHELRMTCNEDVRRVTGYQDFVDDAPLDLIYVADYTRMGMVPAGQRESYASVSAGAISQNVSLYCAAAGLVTVLRAAINCQKRWG